MAEQSPQSEMPTPPADLTEQTRGQGSLIAGIGILWANGGCPSNPCGFPGYGDPYLRGYQTYRWMLQHARIRQARGNVINPVIASTWDYKKRDDKTPDDDVDLVRRNFDPLRSRLVRDACRGFDNGWAAFEPVWDMADGETRLCEVKPLLHDWTTIVVDDNGHFIGLSQGQLKSGTKVKGAGGGEVEALPAPYKAWLYTYDREAGNLYGRSWLENIRETAWKDWLDCAQQLQKLSAKIAGVQAIAKSPASGKTDIIASVKALANGAPGAWLETAPFAIGQNTLNGNPDLYKLVIELSKATLSNIETLDFGSTTPAIVGLLARMAHDEDLMFAGAGLSSRTGMQSEHGSRADSQQHTDTGLSTSELLDDDIAQQLQPLVDAVLVLNKGPNAKGTVRIDCAPLVDMKAERAKAWLTAIVGPGPGAAALAKVTDGVQLAKDLEVPVLEGVKFEVQDAPPPADNVPVKQGMNGNGKVSPRLAKAVNRFSGNGN